MMSYSRRKTALSLAVGLAAAATAPVNAQAVYAPLAAEAEGRAFAPALPQFAPSQPTPATAAYLGGMAYVAGATEATGHELFRVDPASGAVTLVADVNPGPAGSRAYNFVVVGEYLYFVADDGTHGFELWRTDGVTTELLADLRAGADDGLAVAGGFDDLQPAIIGAIDGQLYLRVNGTGAFDVLYVYDAASGGLQAYRDATLAEQAFAHAGERYVVDGFGRVVRLGEGGASERITPNFSPEGDYVSFGDRVLVDHPNDVIFFDPATSRYDTAYDASATTSGLERVRLEHDGQLYFFSAHDELGQELWRTDGTDAGTACLDLAAGEADAPLRDAVVWRGRVVGHDGDFRGASIHAFDPATGEVAVIETGDFDQYAGLAVFDDALFFIGEDDVVYRKDDFDAPAVGVTDAPIGNRRIADWRSLGDLLLLHDPGAQPAWFAYTLGCDEARTVDTLTACPGEVVTVDGRVVVAPAVVTQVEEERARGCDVVHTTYVRVDEEAKGVVLMGPHTVRGEASFVIYSLSGPVTWSDGSFGDSLVVDASVFQPGSGETTYVYTATATISREDGCDYESSISVNYEFVVSTREAGAAAAEVFAFPNPTDGTVGVRGVDAAAPARLHDATGRLLSSTTAADIDLSARPAGLYLLVVEGEDRTHRLLVTRR